MSCSWRCFRLFILFFITYTVISPLSRTLLSSTPFEPFPDAVLSRWNWVVDHVTETAYQMDSRFETDGQQMRLRVYSDFLDSYETSINSPIQNLSFPDPPLRNPPTPTIPRLHVSQSSRSLFVAELDHSLPVSIRITRYSILATGMLDETPGSSVEMSMGDPGLGGVYVVQKMIYEALSEVLCVQCLHAGEFSFICFDFQRNVSMVSNDVFMTWDASRQGFEFVLVEEGELFLIVPLELGVRFLNVSSFEDASDQTWDFSFASGYPSISGVTGLFVINEDDPDPVLPPNMTLVGINAQAPSRSILAIVRTETLFSATPEIVAQLVIDVCCRFSSASSAIWQNYGTESEWIVWVLASSKSFWHRVIFGNDSAVIEAIRNPCSFQLLNDFQVYPHIEAEEETLLYLDWDTSKPYSLSISLCELGTQAGICSACGWCGAGRFSLTVESQSCVTCSYGDYADIATLACVACPSGTYSNNYISSVDDCKLCPSGRYLSDTGSSSPEDCLLCPRGTYGPNRGLTSIDDCIACDPSLHLCPNGSSIPLPKGMYREETVYPEQPSLGMRDSDLLYVKLAIAVTSFLVAIVAGLVFSLFGCVLGRLCKGGAGWTFQSLDLFFDMNHGIREYEWSVRRRTTVGALATLMVFCLGGVLCSWAITDFVANNKYSTSSMEVFFGTTPSGVLPQALSTSYFFAGEFEECSSLTVQSQAGISCSATSTECAYAQKSGMTGCECVWTCTEGNLEQSEMTLDVSLPIGGTRVAFVSAKLSVPHYQETEDSYDVSSSIIENEETLKDSEISLSLIRTKFREHSLFDALLGLELFGVAETQGFSTAVESVSKTTSAIVQLNSGVKFNLRLSPVQYVIAHQYRQSLLSLIAQIAALFGLGLSIIRCFFPFLDMLQERCYPDKTMDKIREVTMVYGETHFPKNTIVPLPAVPDDEMIERVDEGKEEDDEEDRSSPVEEKD